MTATPSPISATGDLWRSLGGRARKSEKLPKGLDAAWDQLVAVAQTFVPRQRLFLRRAAHVVALENEIRPLTDKQLRQQIDSLHEHFRRGRETRHETYRAFAIVREVARRQVGLEPRPVQIAAALAMNAGCLVEAATGEGKTLCATLPATVAGWRGRGCHIVTVNDYLAERDATEMGPIYHFCGLRVAPVTGTMDPTQRRAGYASDITYTTNKEVAADFLRDRIMLRQVRNLPSALVANITREGVLGLTDRLVMRGMEFAIIDEADSILIDEAVTPLIISGESPNAEQDQAYQQAAEVARHFEPEADYHLNRRYREVDFTRAGREKVRRLAQPLGGVWSGVRRSEELVNQALVARDLFLRDEQYVIHDGKVVIVDESTGRLMPDRTWRAGLHQAVEAKEGVEIQSVKTTLARVSFQRFFRVYRKLAGMTGTAWEGRGELWMIYRLPVVRVPTHEPCIREQMEDRIYADADRRWNAVAEHIKQVHEQGRPVLVGTRSVDASEHLSRLLTERGLPHQVLNAVRHREEAEIVARAGRHAQITVATNMAGRGTDIKLGAGVAERGGLHVIATERHESGRIDRQLFGRSGRQGDPGSAVAFASMDDSLVQRFTPRWLRSMIHQPSARVIHRAQRHAQTIALRQRKSVLKHDDWLDEYMGFAARED